MRPQGRVFGFVSYDQETAASQHLRTKNRRAQRRIRGAGVSTLWRLVFFLLPGAWEIIFRVVRFYHHSSLEQKCDVNTDGLWSQSRQMVGTLCENPSSPGRAFRAALT